VIDEVATSTALKELSMKKSIVVFMVVLAMLAVSVAQQPAQQPAAGAQASGQPASQQKTIKDPAEYNAYVNALNQTDPNQKAIALEGFLQQYPNSVMKQDALDLLMGVYQQTGNTAKVTDTAQRLLKADPNNLKALALLTYLGRASAQTPQQLADAAQYAQRGITALQTATKPAGMSDADWQKFKGAVAPIFYGAAGQNALANKDYPTAAKDLQEAVNANPNDLTNVYPLATAYLESNPTNPLGLWYIAKAAALAAQVPQQQQAILRYGRARYIKYHGGDDGWNELQQQAAAQPAPPAGFTVTPAPTPAEVAAKLVQQKPVNQMSFDEIQLVLTSGNQQAADQVWGDLKDKPTKFQAKVVSATPTKLNLAATYDDTENNVTDVDMTMTAAIPARLVPPAGKMVAVEGVPVSYTTTPFMITMEKGILGASEKPEPAKKPAARTPVHRKAQ
jgi:tetratricopeptide (TPR) repeat protein